jgi:hypothetical protein
MSFEMRKESNLIKLKRKEEQQLPIAIYKLRLF